MAGDNRMTLQDFLDSKESKYAVIRSDSYAQDPVAQSISSSPRQFELDGVSFTLLSLEPLTVPQLISYTEQAANGVEFELTVGSGKVTLLTHSKVLELLSSLPVEE
jgi:hypothetical protein